MQNDSTDTIDLSVFRDSLYVIDYISSPGIAEPSRWTIGGVLQLRGKKIYYSGKCSDNNPHTARHYTDLHYRAHQFPECFSVRAESFPDADLFVEYFAFGGSAYPDFILLPYGKGLSSGGRSFHEVARNLPGSRDYLNFSGIQKHS